MATGRWTVRLSVEAERDFVEIIRWSAEQLGPGQARAYAAIISNAIGELTQGPRPPLSRAREDILPGLRTLHVARSGRPARHFLMYLEASARDIDVLRILHDSMDLSRHAPERPD